MNCSLEYEACTRDIAELRWHLRVNNDQLQQVQNILKQVEAQNHQLLKNIDFINKQSPLVTEKLCLEHENMKQIESARSEVRTDNCVLFKPGRKYYKCCNVGTKNKILVGRLKVPVKSTETGALLRQR